MDLPPFVDLTFYGMRWPMVLPKVAALHGAQELAKRAAIGHAGIDGMLAGPLRRPGLRIGTVSISQ